MAYTIAALVQAVTATTGTNNYVLSDPASPGPLRTDAQAVADGSLANGQTIHYMVRDTIVLGDASFEEGIGVYTSATRTVARTAGNVIDGSSGPGVLVFWGASGQRDFYVLRALDGEDVRSAATFATNLGLPRLAAANTFTAVQAISTGGETQQRLINTVAARTWILRHATDGALRVRDDTAVVEPLIFSAGGATITVGSGTTLTKSGGSSYENFPAGTKLLFGTAPPTGWTRVDETNRTLIQLARSADTVGATGGSDDPFDGAWATQGYTLVISDLPSHTHPVDTFAGSGTLSSRKVLNTTATGGESAFSVAGAATATGGGGSHAHGMATPFYRIACWATKN